MEPSFPSCRFSIQSRRVDVAGNGKIFTPMRLEGVARQWIFALEAGEPGAAAATVDGDAGRQGNRTHQAQSRKVHGFSDAKSSLMRCRVSKIFAKFWPRPTPTPMREPGRAAVSRMAIDVAQGNAEAWLPIRTAAGANSVLHSVHIRIERELQLCPVFRRNANPKP
jgi:hypothetical protein